MTRMRISEAKRMAQELRTAPTAFHLRGYTDDQLFAASHALWANRSNGGFRNSSRHEQLLERNQRDLDAINLEIEHRRIAPY